MSVSTTKNFFESFKQGNIYLSIGGLGMKSDIPSTINDIFRRSFFFKRMNVGSFSIACKKIIWEANTVYTQWHHLDTEIHKKNFYCMNENGLIYKCISNNNGEVSIDPPMSNICSKFRTSDGYWWKLVAVATPDSLIKFRNADYIPLTNEENKLQKIITESAIDGSVDRVDVVQSGKGYSETDVFSVVGDGTGAEIEVRLHKITGSVMSITVINGGSGYSTATINVTSETGTEALFDIALSPVGGHGSDPLGELNATYIIGETKIIGDESGFLKDDFKFLNSSIIRTESFSSTRIRNDIEIQTNVVSGNFTVNEKVEFNNGSAIVSGIGENYIRVIELEGEIDGIARGVSSGAFATIDGVFIPAHAVDGEVLYENETEYPTKKKTVNNLRFFPVWYFGT